MALLRRCSFCPSASPLGLKDTRLVAAAVGGSCWGMLSLLSATVCPGPPPKPA